MNNKYYPCVIIGLGGTGIKVLRMIKAIAEHKDINLKRRLANGSIQLLGIDTDPKSNNHVQHIDPNLVNLEGIKRGQNEEIPKTLPLLDDWVLIERQAINDALPKVHETLNTMEAESINGQENIFDSILTSHESIARWFPQSDPKTGSQITQGHSKMAGAAQWRPLGRMAFFLEAPKIYTYLQTALKKVKDESKKFGFVRSYIVSSLAGGTGSGMFWDVAFMLHMIEKELKNFGFFLLADPFESVDEAGRLFPNSYAAIKELVNLKNLRIKTPIKIHYPISEPGFDYELKPRGGIIFDMIYLNQSYPPGFGVSDHNKSTIDVTCYRIAQNIMAQLRTDLHSELDVGANNMSSDVTAMTFSREAGFAFSTSATTQFTLSSSDLLKNLFFKKWITRTQSENRKKIAITYHPSQLNGKDQIAIDGQLVKSVQNWHHGTIVAFTKNPPKELTTAGMKFSKGRAQLLNTGGKKTPKEIFETYVDKTYRKKWAETQPYEDCQPVELTSEDINVEFAKDIEKQISDFIHKFTKNAEQFKTDEIILTDDQRWGYERLVQWLKENETQTAEPEGDGGSDPTVQGKRMLLKRPVAYVKCYNYLNDQDESLLYNCLYTSLKKREDPDNQDNHVNKLVQAIFEELTEQVEKQKTKSEQIIKDAFSKIWDSQKAELLRAAQAILERDKKRKQTNDECQTVEQLVSSQLDTDPLAGIEAGQVDALLRAAITISSSEVTEGENWMEEHAAALVEELNETIDSFFKNKGGVALTAHNYELPCRDPKVLNTALIHLVQTAAKFDLEGFENADEATDNKIESITSYLVELLPNQGKNLLEERGNKMYVELVRELIGNIIEYWVDHSNILLQKSGGEEGLRQRLLNCRSDVFRNGIIENRLKKRHLVIIPPKHTREERTHIYKQNKRDKIKQMFRNISQEVMQITPAVSNQGSDLPIIYYDDLFRSAEEINKISDYYKAYTGYPQGVRRLFHVSRDWVEFDEVVGEGANYDPVYCGNPECDFDIRRLPRTVQICPKCQNPIWNRCGNEDCSSDNVYDAIKKQQNDSGSKYPYKCPECGNDLENYWWECPYHHSKIPMDKEICPYCLAEYQADQRSQDQIGRRANLSVQHCPGCLKLGRKDNEVIKIPQPLIEFYNNGVNGHDTLHFKELIKEYKFLPHLCNFEGKAHYIFPTCPEHIDNKEKRHHLFKDENGKFFCMHHPQIRFYTCSQCGYPIQHEMENSYEQKVLHCPRCFSLLKKCPFCSDKYEKFYAPIIVQNRVDRCPKCYNIMNKLNNPDQTTIDLGIESPAFCRNLFVCNAASQLWYTSSNYDIKKCKVCPETEKNSADPDMSEVSYLLPRENLSEYISNCPMCMALLGMADNKGNIKAYSAKEIWTHFMRKKMPQSGVAIEICKICGTRPVDILVWMYETGYFSDNEEPEWEGEQSTTRNNAMEEYIEILKQSGNVTSLPTLAFNKALDVLSTIYQEKEDRIAYNTLKRLYPLNYLLHNFKKIRQDIMSMFDRSFITVMGLNRRFEALEKYNADILKRERQEF